MELDLVISVWGKNLPTLVAVILRAGFIMKISEIFYFWHKEGRINDQMPLSNDRRNGSKEVDTT